MQIKAQPRQGWAEAAKRAHENGDDELLIPDVFEDENGNVLGFFNEPVQFEVKGVLELIGPKTICLQGGMGGTYVKTTGQAGEGILTIENAQTGKICPFSYVTAILMIPSPFSAAYF